MSFFQQSLYPFFFVCSFKLNLYHCVLCVNFWALPWFLSMCNTCTDADTIKSFTHIPELLCNLTLCFKHQICFIVNLYVCVCMRENEREREPFFEQLIQPECYGYTDYTHVYICTYILIECTRICIRIRLKLCKWFGVAENRM